MTDREKLTNIVCCAIQSECVGHCNHKPCTTVEIVVDDLLASGVMVQNWRNAKTDPPNEDSRVLVTVTANVDHKGSRMDTDRMHNGSWVRWGHLVSEWMPLPESTKGEPYEKR